MQMIILCFSFGFILFIVLGNLASCAGDANSNEQNENSENFEEDSVMKFTFGMHDDTGPTFWKTKGGKSTDGFDNLHYASNQCPSNWLSPINIKSSRVRVAEQGKWSESKGNNFSVGKREEEWPESLIIATSVSHIEQEAWEFGHPTSTYHGVEVRSFNYAALELMDNFEPLGKSTPLTTYNFHFLTIFYCDLNKAHRSRSMHQIDGQKFPLELHFVFFKSLRTRQEQEELLSGIDKAEHIDYDEERRPDSYDENKVAVIVVVHGQIATKANKYLQPVIDAANNFYGKSFGVDENDNSNVIKIAKPWSPTWLLPDTSAYYFYDDGSFPIPPCFKVHRYYIMKEPINITQEQLDVLSDMRTEREENDRMPCTFSEIQDELLTGEVALNLIEYHFIGDDHKPRTAEEEAARKERKTQLETFRNRLNGKAVVGGGNSDKMICQARFGLFLGFCLLIFMLLLQNS